MHQFTPQTASGKAILLGRRLRNRGFIMEHSIAINPKILAIAPYPGLAELFSSVKAARSDLDLDIITGDREAGLAAARAVAAEKDYDVIVSRGGTAELVQQNMSLPVLEIEITANDILHALRLSEAYNGKSAFVGFEAITRTAALLCQLLNYDLPVYTIHNSEEAERVLATLSQDGYSLVLCDTIVTRLAEKNGLTPVLITSNRASVERILEEAVSIGRPLALAKTQLQLAASIIVNNGTSCVVMEENGNIIYSSLPQELQTLMETQPIPERLDLKAQLEQKVTRPLGDKLYTFETRTDATHPGLYFVYIHASEFSLDEDRQFMKTYADHSEMNAHFLNKPNIAAANGAYLESITKRVSGFKPVMILGEDGTFQDNIAMYLCNQYRLPSDILTVLDFSFIDQVKFDWLLTSTDSPLRSANATVYLKHVHYMTPVMVHRLTAFLSGRSANLSGWILFSADCDTSGRCPAAAQIADQLAPEIVTAQPLRKCREILPNLAILCISRFNAQYSRQVISLSPDALEAAAQYDWPGNYAQFQRVIKELVLHTDNLFISRKEMEEAIGAEAGLYPELTQTMPEGCVTIPLDQHLEDSIYTIVREAVDRQDGNQKRTAEILGISRTTIWRILKQDSM